MFGQGHENVGQLSLNKVLYLKIKLIINPNISVQKYRQNPGITKTATTDFSYSCIQNFKLNHPNTPFKQGCPTSWI